MKAAPSTLGPEAVDEPITIRDYDPAWLALLLPERDRVQRALGKVSLA